MKVNKLFWLNEFRILLLLLVILFAAGCRKEEPVEVVPETCVDGVKNQNEVTIDCGGVCPVCELSCVPTLNALDLNGS